MRLDSPLSVATRSPTGSSSYRPWVLAGSLLALSGQFPVVEGRVAHPGRLGEIPDEEGRNAARICALNALAQIEAALGDWDRLDTILRVEGHIACVPGWTGHAGVSNGASELLREVLGPRAGHARAVFGQVSLPMHAPVELVVTASVRLASFTPSEGERAAVADV
jgi:enamine deaminase RidA (YjgF/YER057c/UK114 family)